MSSRGRTLGPKRGHKQTSMEVPQEPSSAIGKRKKTPKRDTCITKKRKTQSTEQEMYMDVEGAYPVDDDYPIPLSGESADADDVTADVDDVPEEPQEISAGSDEEEEQYVLVKKSSLKKKKSADFSIATTPDGRQFKVAPPEQEEESHVVRLSTRGRSEIVRVPTPKKTPRGKLFRVPSTPSPLKTPRASTPKKSGSSLCSLEDPFSNMPATWSPGKDAHLGPNDEFRPLREKIAKYSSYVDGLLKAGPSSANLKDRILSMVDKIAELETLLPENKVEEEARKRKMEDPVEKARRQIHVATREEKELYRADLLAADCDIDDISLERALFAFDRCNGRHRRERENPNLDPSFVGSSDYKVSL